MNKLTRLAAVMIASAIISSPAFSQSKAVVTVNGQAISQGVFDVFLAEELAQGRLDSPDLREQIKQRLVAQELLVQEAKRKGSDKKAEYTNRLDILKSGLLVNIFLADYIKANPISDDKLKKDYEAIKASLGSTEYKARHVLVEKEEDAKAIIAKLDKGEKFADLAKQSKDQNSKDSGGDLDWNAPNRFVKPFSDAMTALKKGEYTKTPVKTDFGFHVIQLDDTRPMNPPPFDQVKPQLQRRASQQMVEQLIKDLRAKAKVN